MKKLLSISAVLLLSLVLVSCSTFKKGADKKSNLSLDDSSWELQTITNFEVEETRQPITLNFAEESRYGGHSGCNNYGGTFEISGKSILAFSPSIATKMACDIGMDTESRYLQMLSEVDGYHLDTRTLNLKQGDEVIATFVKSKN